MNAAEFASRLLDLIASAVPEEATVSKRLEGEIDALIEEFTAMPEPVLKLDEDRRMVYGWASVISKNGTPIIDRQGDVVTTDELRSAVHDFMKHRTAGDMHGELGVGEVVESFVLDRAVQKSLGIDLGIEGWYVGVHVPNDEVWEKVKDGTYGAFSIGGSAVREAISDEEAAGYTVVKGYKTLNDGTPDGDAKCPKCGKKPCCCGKKKMRKSDDSVGKAQRRHPKGSPQGGEFAPSGGGKGAKKTPAKTKFKPDKALYDKGKKQGAAEMRELMIHSPAHASGLVTSWRQNYKNALANMKKPSQPRAYAAASLALGYLEGAMEAKKTKPRDKNGRTMAQAANHAMSRISRAMNRNSPRGGDRKAPAKKAPVGDKALGHKNMLSLSRAVGEGKMSSSHLRAARALGVKDAAKIKTRTEEALDREIRRAGQMSDRAPRDYRDGGKHEGALYEQYYQGVYDALAVRRQNAKRPSSRRK